MNREQLLAQLLRTQCPPRWYTYLVGEEIFRLLLVIQAGRSAGGRAGCYGDGAGFPVDRKVLRALAEQLVDYAGGAEAAAIRIANVNMREEKEEGSEELTSPYRPLSRSFAVIVIIGLAGAAVSDTVAVYVGLPKEGALSLASVMAIVTVAVDESFGLVCTSSAITWGNGERSRHAPRVFLIVIGQEGASLEGALSRVPFYRQLSEMEKGGFSRGIPDYAKCAKQVSDFGHYRDL